MLDTTIDIDLNGLEILVVEDDPTSALYLSRVLAKCGATVDTAIDGSDGLLNFLEKPYPVVITDINMPGLNGLELVSRIKELDSHVHIIATSANKDVNCLIRAVELGFCDYFVKPVDINKLLLAVRKCGDLAAANQQLANERSKFKTVVDSLGEGIIIKDLDFKILYQNKASLELFGDHAGLPCYTLFGMTEPCLDCSTVQALNDGLPHTCCRVLQVNGNTIHIETNSSLIRDSRGMVTGTIDVVRDVSERIRNEQIIHDMAFLAPLTGLPNRRLFEDRLEQTIAKSQRYIMKFGVMYLDLDFFKQINDSFGHEYGDFILKEASERIRSCCKRDVDTISRLGGDEFCIIITDCSISDLEEIAQNLLQAFSIPFRVLATDVIITASIGISVFPDDSTDPQMLESAADKAMYCSKHSGRNSYSFFKP